MQALISVKYGNGKRTRCDATCYNAKTNNSHKCMCICGGANHGVGLSKALENTQALNGQWVKNWQRSHKGPIKVDLTDQLKLPLA